MYPACILHVSCMSPHVSSNLCRYMYPSCIPYVVRMHPTCIPHVSHMYPSCIARAFLLAGVPTLQQLQGRAKEMKRAKTAAVHLDQLIDLKHILALRYYEPMPAPLTLMPCVYPARLGRSVQDTCMVMYPDCILKCRHDASKIHVS